MADKKVKKPVKEKVEAPKVKKEKVLVFIENGPDDE